MLTIKFRAQCKDGHVEKPKGGFLIGTSPEFEIAIYTAAHLLAGLIFSNYINFYYLLTQTLTDGLFDDRRQLFGAKMKFNKKTSHKPYP